MYALERRMVDVLGMNFTNKADYKRDHAALNKKILKLDLTGKDSGKMGHLYKNKNDLKSV